jgi:hypothetical protein
MALCSQPLPTLEPVPESHEMSCIPFQRDGPFLGKAPLDGYGERPTAAAITEAKPM